METLFYGFVTVLVGLLMGGIPGIGTALVFYIIYVVIKEQEREKMRQRNWETMHPNPRTLISYQEMKRKEEEEKNKIYDRLSEQFKHIELVSWWDIKRYHINKEYMERVVKGIGEKVKLQEEYNKYFLQDRVNIEFSQLNKGNGGEPGEYLSPDRNPFVVVEIYEQTDDPKYTKHGDLILRSNGAVYNPEVFEKKLMEDSLNPNIEKYNLGYNGASFYVGLLNRGPSHKFRYMYTVDGGKNFVVCW